MEQITDIYIDQPHPIYLAPGLDGSLGTLTFSNVCGNVWSLKVWHLEHSWKLCLGRLGNSFGSLWGFNILEKKQPTSSFFCCKIQIYKTIQVLFWQVCFRSRVQIKTEAQTLHREIGNEGAVFQAADLVGWIILRFHLGGDTICGSCNPLDFRFCFLIRILVFIILSRYSWLVGWARDAGSPLLRHRGRNESSTLPTTQTARHVERRRKCSRSTHSNSTIPKYLPRSVKLCFEQIWVTSESEHCRAHQSFAVS